MTANVQDAVQSVANSYGYGQYRVLIGDIASRIEAGASEAEVSRALRNYGLVDTTAASVVSQVFEALSSAEEEDVDEADDEIVWFDREQAAHVIRTFIQSGYDSNVTTSAYEEAEVDALLVLAGLVDEPEPEPEPEVEQMTAEEQVSDVARRIEATINTLTTTVDRLVGFARQHGYRG